LVSKPAVERAFPRQKNPQTLILQAFHEIHWASAKPSAKSLFPSSSLGGASSKTREMLVNQGFHVFFCFEKTVPPGKTGVF